ncbi:DUF3953 domain-containing protein [Alkalibacillus haloalkaliphilus]|uniref:DUF3953 domain-containing protein n=1 Tax=Alkalibacillus haloalkaliphilus TaxID=94136 RepID=UPI0029360F7C|nr:DUF3953 domain-containing protein [Alkalibacillus haloalkaliphilus]MDV2582399.1 DUF3953 domain-containing protein [Alkalibacillus haloalkaliphilus]
METFDFKPIKIIFAVLTLILVVPFLFNPSVGIVLTLLLLSLSFLIATLGFEQFEKKRIALSIILVVTSLFTAGVSIYVLWLTSSLVIR